MVLNKFHHAATQNLIVSLSIDNVHPAASQILFLIAFSKFHHVATQNPGHGTKFVTLPSSLLCCKFHIFIEIGSICHCNR